MTETQKLRDAFDRYEAHVRGGYDPAHGSAAVHDAITVQLLARMQVLAVFALEEQIGDYQRYVGNAMVVQCKVCSGAGRGVGSSSNDPCPGCRGAGLVRV